MDKDIFLNKKSIIERCLLRIKEDYAGDEKNLHEIRRQDAIVLNLQRACEAAIDLAMHVISDERLGVPQSSRDAFDKLVEKKRISAELGDRLKKMIGFRNIAIHDYQSLNLDILKKVLDVHLNDFNAFLNKLS